MSEHLGWLAGLQAVVVLLVAGMYLLVPRSGGRGSFFGWPVEPGWAASAEALEVRRRYRRTVLGWSAVAMGLAATALLGGGAGIALSSVAPAIQVVGGVRAWSAVRRAVLPRVALGEPSTVRRASLLPESGALRPLLDLGGLLPLGLAALWLRAHWDQIPPRFVVHWGPNGPDGWATNTPGQVFAPLLFGAVLVVGFAGLHGFIRALTPAGTTPRSRAGRQTVSMALTGAGWLVGALTAAGSFVALGAGPGTVIGVGVAGTAALGAAMLWQMVRLSRLPPEPVPPSAHPRAWRAGGLFYVAPDDPAVWVPKLVGVGWTVNLGHRRGQVTFALLILVPIAVTIGAILLPRLLQ